MTAAVFAVCIFVAVLWLYSSAQARHEREIAAVRRAMGELINYVDTIDASLNKLGVVAGPVNALTVANKLYATAALAKGDIEQLPLGTEGMASVSRFLSQVGDYVNVVAKKMAKGEALSEDEAGNLNLLTDYASQLRRSLNDVGGGTRLADIPQFTTDLSTVSDVLEDYPSLIYDGPYSDHVLSVEPLLTRDAPHTVPLDAVAATLDFVGEYRIGDAFVSHSTNNNCPIYGVHLTLLDASRSNMRGGYAAVTVNGGHVMLFSDSRVPTQDAITVDDARRIAATFLRDAGIHGMVERYYYRTDHYLTVNFAYLDNGYIAYPDLIKVEVALDNGEIIGYNATGYVYNHAPRRLPPYESDIDEIVGNLSPDTATLDVKRAIIPTPHKTERHCYEITATRHGRRYLLYYDVMTGEQCDILLLQEDGNGTLTR